MMTLSSRAAATALASLLLIRSAFAQTTTPATAPATKMAPAEKKAEPATNGAFGQEGPQRPRTAASLECSKEADTKGVHGKQRKKFMSECKNAAKDDAGPIEVIRSRNIFILAWVLDPKGPAGPKLPGAKQRKSKCGGFFAPSKLVTLDPRPRANDIFGAMKADEAEIVVIQWFILR